jgi:hypothetical protein
MFDKNNTHSVTASSAFNNIVRDLENIQTSSHLNHSFQLELEKVAMKHSPIDLDDPSKIERHIESFAMTNREDHEEMRSNNLFETL